MSEKNAAGAMHQVFISYASDKGESAASDLQAADMVCSALEAQGVRCFIAHRDIEPGDRWAVKMIDALKRSQIVVPVVSANSEKSQWVNDEITIALDKGIKIIPFCIEDIEPEGVLELLKVRSQWINAYPKTTQAHLDRLVKAVRSHLGEDKEKEPEKIVEHPITKPKDMKEKKPGKIAEAPTTRPKVPKGKKKRFPPKKWLLTAASLVIAVGILFILNQVLNKTDTPRDEDSQQQKEQPKLEKQTGDLEEKDDSDWETALSKHTIPAFRDYLDKHPTGKHASEATEKIAELKKLVEMSEDVKRVEAKIGKDKLSWNEKDCCQADFGEGIVMVYIPAGEFTMGSNESSDEKPHPVSLDGYWLGKTELTIKQYMQFVNDTKSHYPVWLEESSKYNINNGTDDYYKKFVSDENCPIVGVSWDNSKAYCDWLSKKTGLSFKLSTEAQWEKGARGSGGRKYPWGDREPDKDLANFAYNIGKTTPVGSYPAGASPYGLLDMAGNVWEWCSDWYAVDYYNKPESRQENPTGPEGGPNRVIRGGSWGSISVIVRCAYRFFKNPTDRYNFVGFRLCLVI